MSVIWLRLRAPRLVVTAGLFLCLLAGPQPLQAAGACENAGSVVTTCADLLSDAHQSFLRERKNRAITLDPEDGQVSRRISGRAWHAANGSLPMFLAPAGTAIEVETSLSKWGAYFAREDAEKIESVKDSLPDGMKLPDPASARIQKIDLWSSMTLEGVLPSSSRQGVISHFGADYTVSEDFLIGASVEFEDLEQYTGALGAATASGKAFMVGPYLASRLVDNLLFDAQLAWGQSTDAVGVDGMAESFETERSLAKARLAGDVDLAGWQVVSSAAFIHAMEAPAGGMRDGVTTNTITLGPEIRRTFRLEDGPVIESFFHYRNAADLEAVESLSDLDALAFEGSLGGGLNVTLPDSYAIKATAEVEGREDETNPNVTGRVQLTVPLP